MRILSRYLVGRFLRTFLTTCLAMTGGMVIVQLLLNMDDVIGAKQGLVGVLLTLWLDFLAYYVPILLPVAVFISAFVSLGLAARSLEMLAAKAGGVNLARITLPLLVAALGIGAGGLLLHETLVLDAMRTLRMQSRDGEGAIEYRKGSFWYHWGNHIYSVGRADPATGRLWDVEIFELDDSWRLERRITAASAKIEGGKWHLQHATIREFDPDDPGRPDSFQEVHQTTVDTTASSGRALLEADAVTLATPDLLRYIAARAESGDDVSKFRAMVQLRLAEPMVALVLALLAVPFALQSERSRNLAVPAVKAAFVMSIFWFSREIARMIAQSDGALIYAPWIMIGLFLAFGGWRLARMAQ